MTTFTEFVDRLGACSIAGVNCVLTEPPLSLNTADLPASWVGLPSGDGSPLVLCGGAWPTFAAPFIVAVEPVGQSTQGVNYRDSLTIIDALHDGLCNCIGDITKSKISWAIRMAIVDVAGVTYWAVVADVTGSG